MSSTETTRLTYADWRAIARARELGAARSIDELREWTATGSFQEADCADSAAILASALGVAQYLLPELAAIIERPDGSGA